MKREEIIKEEYAWQVEECEDGFYWLIIAETNINNVSVADIMKLYADMKKKGKKVRLLRWSKIVKYEVMDGEGF